MGGPAFQRPIGLVSLVCLVIGNMIGAGVYVSSSYALASLGDARLVLLVWLVGGLHAIAGSISYAALAKRMPISGGEYAYLTRCVDPSIGFVAGWISLIAGFTAPIAAAALLLGRYVAGATETSTESRIVATVAILCGATAYAIHLRVGAWLNNTLVAFKFFCFFLFLVLGIPFVLSHHYSGFSPAMEEQLAHTTSHQISVVEQLYAPGKIDAMIGSLFFAALAYTGFNASIYIVGQIDGPLADARNKSKSRQTQIVGKSMILACVCVTILYLVLNWVFLYGLAPDKIIAGKEYFVSDVAQNIGGESLRGLMQFAIILSGATSIMAMLATGPRVYAQMAEDGRLPRLFATNDDVPVWAIAVQGVCSAFVVWLVKLKEIIEYLGLTLTVCGALTVCTVWFGRQRITQQMPLRWYEHTAAAIYVFGAMVMLWTARSISPGQFWACLFSFGTGIVIYAIATIIQRRRPKSNVPHEMT